MNNLLASAPKARNMSYAMLFLFLLKSYLTLHVQGDVSTYEFHDESQPAQYSVDRVDIAL